MLLRSNLTLAGASTSAKSDYPLPHFPRRSVFINVYELHFNLSYNDEEAEQFEAFLFFLEDIFLSVEVEWSDWWLVITTVGS